MTTIDISAKTGPGPYQFTPDAQLLDIETLSDEARQKIAEALQSYERRILRAAALHERLAARGFAREAEVLRVRDLTSDFDATLLDALETIVTDMMSGGHHKLCAALSEGDDAQTLLRTLAAIHEPTGPIATGERLAAILRTKSDDELAGLALSPQKAEALIEQIEQAADSLQTRLKLAVDVLARLERAGILQKGRLQ